MQFLTTLFGGDGNPLLTSLLALGLVIVLIVLGLWILKVFFRASNTLAQGRGRRMMILETLALDPRRQLILIRRDDVEYLVLTGGPQDVVLDSHISAPPKGLQQRAATQTGAGIAPSTLAERASPTAPETSRPTAKPAATPPSGALDGLRELTRPLSRPQRSLRQTGLLRPVSRGEPAAIIPMTPEVIDTRRPDSAKSAPANDSGERAGLGAATFPGSGYTAEGN